MNLSEEGIAFIKQWEGFRAKAYICPAGKITIGYGHVLKPNENYDHLTEGISDSIATDLLLKDLKLVEDNINIKVKAPLFQNQYDALCSLVYNVGCGAFNRSRGLLQLNKENYKDAIIEFFSKERGFVNINANKSLGLINRRKAEQILWEKNG